MQEALAALGSLAGVTPGWNNDSDVIMDYAERLIDLGDPVALMQACEKIATTWTEPRRPPLAHILNIYRQEHQRRAPQALSYSPGKHVSFEQGIEIAWQAYRQEVVRQGREPDRKKFEKWLPR